jgi:hypothetical protein
MESNVWAALIGPRYRAILFAMLGRPSLERRGHLGWTYGIRHVKYCKIAALTRIGGLFTEKLLSEGTQNSRTAHDPSAMLIYPTESQNLGPKQCNDAETVMPNNSKWAVPLVRLQISVEVNPDPCRSVLGGV